LERWWKDCEIDQKNIKTPMENPKNRSKSEPELGKSVQISRAGGIFWVLRRVSERFHSRVVVFLRVFERYGGPVSAIRILASLLPLKKHRTDEMSDRRVTSLARSAQNDSCLMGVEWQQVEQ